MLSSRMVAVVVTLFAFSGVAGCDKEEASMVPVSNTQADAQEQAKPEIDCGKYWQKCMDKGKDEAYMDLSKGLEWYLKVCNGPAQSTKQGDSTMRGCVMAGRALLKGDAKLAKGPAQAKTLFAKACAAEYADGCADLGGGFMGSDFGPPNDAEAAKYLQKACDLGKQFSCSDAGRMAKLVKYGRKQDWPKLCEGGKGQSCLKLAMFHYKAVPKENEKAAVFFDKACAAGESLGCDVLAQMYVKKWVKTGKRVKHDDKALEYWGKGCDLKCTICCSERGLLLHKNKKYKAALADWEKACELGGEGARMACASAGQLFLSGRGTKKDLSKARGVLRKACDQGESTACKQVKDIDKATAKKK